MLRCNLPIKILRSDHTELVGSGFVLLTAPHATGHEADHMGQIVEDAALASRAYAVIGKVGSQYSDPDRIETARTDFRKSIDSIIEEDAIKCVLDTKGKEETGVDVGTGLGSTCTDETGNLVKSFLSRDFAVTVNRKYQGMKPESVATSYHRVGSTGAFMVEAVQLEFGREERQLKRDKVVNDLAELVGLLNVKVGFVPSETLTTRE